MSGVPSDVGEAGLEEAALGRNHARALGEGVAGETSRVRSKEANQETQLYEEGEVGAKLSPPSANQLHTFMGQDNHAIYLPNNNKLET